MIVDRIYRWARIQPDKPALIHNGSALSYAAFAGMIEARRAWFASKGAAAGGTALVLIGDLAAAWATVLGLRAAGLTTICAASLADTAGLNIQDVGRIVYAEGEGAPHSDGDAFPRAMVFELPVTLDRDPAPGASAGFTGPPTGGHILYTSGTTGQYKKVLCAAEQELARLTLIARSRGNTLDTVNHALSFGLWTTIGYTQPLSVWLMGGVVVTDQRPSALERFFDHGVNKSIVLPPVLQKLIEFHGAAGEPLHACALSVSGGFCPRDVLERTLSTLTDDLSVAYGSTECGSIARSRFSGPEDHDWLAPALDRTIEIVDEFDRPLGDDQEGLLRVRLLEGDANGYLDDEEATARHFRGGYFYPGDLAVRRADGRVRILGRFADVLNIQGQKRAVAPLEQRLQSFLGIENVCLFSRLDGDGRDELIIALETERTLTPVENEQILLNYRMYGRIRVVTLPRFPRTETGMQKIRRTDLRRMIAG